jgi:ABC-2 type transport system permease protein
MSAAASSFWRDGHLARIGRRAWAMSSVYYALMLTYRMEIILWAVSTSLPLIMMGIWAEAGKSGGFVLTQVQMVRYFIAVFIIRQLTIVWVIHEFDYNVVSGRLSALLLQPIDPAWRYVTMHIGEQWSRWPFVGVLVAMCFVLYPAALWGDEQTPGFWLPPWWQILLAIVACYCAYALRFLMQYCLAMGAFWLERVAAFHQVIFLPYIFFSGLLFPLQELPAGWLEIFLWTPFPYMVWFPVSLLIEPHVPAKTIVTGFVVMAAWMVGLYLLNRWLWRRGLRHYSAMGA